MSFYVRNKVNLHKKEGSQGDATRIFGDWRDKNICKYDSWNKTIFYFFAILYFTVGIFPRFKQTRF